MVRGDASQEAMLGAASEVATPLPWRILVVDDCDDDAELIEIALHHALQVECRRVHGEAPLLAALRMFEPHLVLSDLNMPGFPGERALALVREHVPAARFVFLTGALNESAPPLPPTDGMLLKDDLARLPGLVRRLLAG
jgi:CheY-like chemotaxis protein